MYDQQLQELITRTPLTKETGDNDIKEKNKQLVAINSFTSTFLRECLFSRKPKKIIYIYKMQ